MKQSFGGVLLALLCLLPACTEEPGTPNVTLRVDMNGEGEGAVNLITEAQTRRFDQAFVQTLPSGQTLTLRALAAEGSSFAGWGGACSGKDADCSLTLDADTTARASFAKEGMTPDAPDEPGEPDEPEPAPTPEPENITLTGIVLGEGALVNAAGTWTCSSSCEHSYSKGSAVVLEARAAEGSTFVAWGGACEGVAQSQCSLTLNADARVEVTFEVEQEPEPERYRLSVTKTGTGTGLISGEPGKINCGNVCEDTFEAGQLVTLQAVADENALFKGWTACPQVAGSSCQLTLTKDSTVSAEFERVTGEETTITIPVRKGSDDAEQYVSGARVDGDRFVENAVDTKNGDFDLTYDTLTRTEVIAGLRFSELPVPQGALVKSAHIQFYSDEDYDKPNTTETTMLFEVEADTKAETFVHQSVGTISGRTTTGAEPVSWSPEPWAFEGEGTETERSPDVARLLQDLVSRSDWDEDDNAVVFIVTGSGYRVATTYEDSDPQAELVVTFAQ